MKKLIFSMLCVWATLAATAQEAMHFAEGKWNFGTIREQDGVVNHTFAFTNRTAHPIVIEYVETGCGCAVADFSRRPVMAGQQGRIDVSYDPLGRSGPFNKTIVITANGRTIQQVISIEGRVQERERTLEEQYPVALPGGVRLTTRALNFRYVAQGEASAMVIGWVNPGSRAVNFAVEVEPGSPLVKVSAPRTFCAGCRGEITIAYDLTGQTSAYGVFSNSLWAVVEGVRDRVPIVATAYGVDRFAGATPASAPRARLDGQYHDFGALRTSGKPVPVEFTLTNAGQMPLIVRAVSAPPGITTDLKPGTSLQASQSVAFRITLAPARMRAGSVSESIVIIVNDPLRPMREIRVAAEIR